VRRLGHFGQLRDHGSRDPSSAAIAFFGTPSATSRRIYAQFSIVITLPFSGVHLSPAFMFSFQAASTEINSQSTINKHGRGQAEPLLERLFLMTIGYCPER